MSAVRKIFKYPIPMEIHPFKAGWNSHFELELPEGAEILTVQAQANQPVIWALVYSERPTEKRKMLLLNTGASLELESYHYIGTFQVNGGGLVFHLFEDLA